MTAKYDIAVFGASGFTGQLVARYLASRAPDEGFKLVAVGRNREKVAKRMKEVGVTADILTADSTDEKSLREVLGQVKVVASLIGPYMAHGELLYKLCAEMGVHYCDLTGELAFPSRSNGLSLKEAHSRFRLLDQVKPLSSTRWQRTTLDQLSLRKQS